MGKYKEQGTKTHAANTYLPDLLNQASKPPRALRALKTPTTTMHNMQLQQKKNQGIFLFICKGYIHAAHSYKPHALALAAPLCQSTRLVGVVSFFIVDTTI